MKPHHFRSDNAPKETLRDLGNAPLGIIYLEEAEGSELSEEQLGRLEEALQLVRSLIIRVYASRARSDRTLHSQ